jgi:hypothetical protein
MHVYQFTQNLKSLDACQTFHFINCYCKILSWDTAIHSVSNFLNIFSICIVLRLNEENDKTSGSRALRQLAI